MTNARSLTVFYFYLNMIEPSVAGDVSDLGFVMAIYGHVGSLWNDEKTFIKKLTELLKLSPEETAWYMLVLREIDYVFIFLCYLNIKKIVNG